MRRIAWVLSLLMSKTVAGAWPPVAVDSCDEGLEASVQRQSKALDAEYDITGGGGGGLRRSEDGRSTAPFVLTGDRRVILLLHGFLASPPEMRPLAELLHERTGNTVYVPAIPGFGGPPQAMRGVRLEHWRFAVRDALAAAEKCSDEIAVVGYSLGGGLAIEHLLGSSEGQVASTDSRIASLTLLSPYVRGARWQLSRLGVSAPQALLGLLRHAMRLERVRLERVYRWSGRRYRDLEIVLQDPLIYDQAFSLRGGLDLLALDRRLRRLRRRLAHRPQLPVFLAVTAADRTIDWRAARRYVGEVFANVEHLEVIDRDRLVPHQIVVPDARRNPDAEALFERIAGFVAASWSRAEEVG